MIDRTSILEWIEEIARNLQSRENQGLDELFGQNSNHLRAIFSKLNSSESDIEFKSVLETDLMGFLESFGKAASHGLQESASELEKVIQSLEGLLRSVRELDLDSLVSEISAMIGRLADYQFRIRSAASTRF